MSDDLFDFLEADLAGPAPDPEVAVAREDAVPLLQRAAQLVTADWAEDEAARELARTTRYEDLRDAHLLLLRALLRSPFVERKGIRIARIMWRALDVQEAAAQQHPDVASA
jgi:predicted nucleic acid-binding protein